jgi:predicted PurR-regulated permease PerM
MNQANRFQYTFFFILLLLSVSLVFLVVKSFLAPLILAFTLAIIFRPVYNRILKKLNGRGTIASLLTVALVICVVLIPLIIIVQILLREALNLYVWFNNFGGKEELFTNLQNSIEYYFPGMASRISLDATLYVRQALQWTIDHVGSFFSEFFRIALGLVIMVIGMFYILRDGETLKQQYIKLSPLPDKYDAKIFASLSSSLESVLKGAFIIAIIQGFMGGIGSLLGGYSSPVIFGIATATVSFLPGIGPGSVLIPAIVFKFVTGHIVSGILFLVWYLIGLTVIDNILAPHIYKRGGIEVHQFFILIGILGGLCGKNSA